VSPNPVRNKEFAETLGRVLHRPALLPVPAFALKLLFGEMADATVLVSQRVVAGVLAEAGFMFSQPGLDEALREMLAS
jgi:NAD dependent epimerase/dehydratase family enzyme